MKPTSLADVLRDPRGHSPVVVAHARRHAADVQLRVADVITRFAGEVRPPPRSTSDGPRR